jgi:hypothetical protein
LLQAGGAYRQAARGNKLTHPRHCLCQAARATGYPDPDDFFQRDNAPNTPRVLGDATPRRIEYCDPSILHLLNAQTAPRIHYSSVLALGNSGCSI